MSQAHRFARMRLPLPGGGFTSSDRFAYLGIAEPANSITEDGIGDTFASKQRFARMRIVVPDNTVNDQQDRFTYLGLVQPSATAAAEFTQQFDISYILRPQMSIEVSSVEGQLQAVISSFTTQFRQFKKKPQPLHQRLRRRRYVVEIDGEFVEVSSMEEAEALTAIDAVEEVRLPKKVVKDRISVPKMARDVIKAADRYVYKAPETTETVRKVSPRFALKMTEKATVERKTTPRFVSSEPEKPQVQRKPVPRFVSKSPETNDEVLSLIERRVRKRLKDK